MALKNLYAKKSPYKISKEFLISKNKNEIHTYGETPLTEFYDFLIRADVSEKDVFIDLGCGRGQIVFLVSTFFGCSAVGVDCIPVFCERAERIAAASNLPCRFVCEDMQNLDLKAATILYFYALWHEEDYLKKMIRKLSLLNKGTRIITVGFPLCDYSSSFSVLFSSPCSYPWGKTELFLNVII